MLDYQRVLFLILHDPCLLVRSALLFWIFVEMSEPWPFLTDITVPGRSIPYHWRWYPCSRWLPCPTFVWLHSAWLFLETQIADISDIVLLSVISGIQYPHHRYLIEHPHVWWWKCDKFTGNHHLGCPNNLTHPQQTTVMNQWKCVSFDLHRIWHFQWKIGWAATILFYPQPGLATSGVCIPMATEVFTWSYGFDPMSKIVQTISLCPHLWYLCHS